MSEETNKSFEYRIKHDRDFVIEQHRKMWRYIANEISIRITGKEGL